MPSIEFPDFWVPFGYEHARRVNPDSDDAYAFQVYEPINDRWATCASPGRRPWREASDPEKPVVEPRTMEPLEYMRWLYDHQRVLVCEEEYFKLRHDEDAGYQYGRSDCDRWVPANSILWHAHRLVPEDGEPWGDE